MYEITVYREGVVGYDSSSNLVLETIHIYSSAGFDGNLPLGKNFHDAAFSESNIPGRMVFG